MIDFISANGTSKLELVEDERGHDDCFDWSGPVATRGRLWVDAATHDVLRVDRRLAGPIDVRVPTKLQRRYNFTPWITLDRDDLTMHYQAGELPRPRRSGPDAGVDRFADRDAKRPAVDSPDPDLQQLPPLSDDEPYRQSTRKATLARSFLFGQHLRLRFSVRKETRLVALRPRGSLLRAADVPIGTAALQHRAQVEAQLLHRRPARRTSSRCRSCRHAGRARAPACEGSSDCDPGRCIPRCRDPSAACGPGPRETSTRRRRRRGTPWSRSGCRSRWSRGGSSRPASRDGAAASPSCCRLSFGQKPPRESTSTSGSPSCNSESVRCMPRWSDSS